MDKESERAREREMDLIQIINSDNMDMIQHKSDDEEWKFVCVEMHLRFESIVLLYGFIKTYTLNPLFLARSFSAVCSLHSLLKWLDGWMHELTLTTPTIPIQKLSVPNRIEEKPVNN